MSNNKHDCDDEGGVDWLTANCGPACPQLP